MRKLFFAFFLYICFFAKLSYSTELQIQLSNGIHSMELKKINSVLDIKKELSDKFNLPIDKIRIVIRGAEKKDDKEILSQDQLAKIGYVHAIFKK